MESGINKKSNVLILTSFFSDDNSSKMIKDMAKSLMKDYDVDILSKYPHKSNDFNVYSAYSYYEQLLHSLSSRIIAKLSYYKNKIIKVDKKKTNLPYLFFGLDEENPPVKVERILNQIKKDYDFILVFFWQGMITSKTLQVIYKETKKPLLLVAADMFPMTGGCSYFWDCERLEIGCGKCPGIQSWDENDITRKNFSYKKKVISSINSVFLGNTWQIGHASKSGLFKNLDKIYPIVDESVFKPKDKNVLKEKFECSNKKVLFFGALGVDDPRKGFEYLVNALQILSKQRPDLVKDIVLFVAGKGDIISDLSDYTINYIGHLSFIDVAEYYALADIFLSPSIQDAGPMMLNQALMCGTPAVAFNIGVANDIINKNTGYLAEYKNSKDFCKGIIELIEKSDLELKNISDECRRESLKRSSYDSFRSYIVNSYDKIKNDKIICH